MKSTSGTSWTRRGVSLLWGSDSLAKLIPPEQVVTIRQFFELARNWPDDLPGDHGNLLIVGGMEGCLDLLSPKDASGWLEAELRPAIVAFQEEYGLEAALVFWLPSGRRRIKMTPANEAYLWVCASPHTQETIEIGRILWGGAEEDAVRILDPNQSNQDPDGAAWIGLSHPRLS